jgi:hypothetical protein
VVVQGGVANWRIPSSTDSADATRWRGYDQKKKTHLPGILVVERSTTLSHLAAAHADRVRHQSTQ